MKRIIVPADFFVVRTPRLAVEQFKSLPLDESAQNDFLAEWLNQPYIMQALYLASPSFVRRVNDWLNTPTDKKNLKTKTTLLKYFIRMSCRPTPFGLFSSISLGRVGKETNLTYEENRYKRITRLDTHYIFSIRESLSNTANFEKATYLLNPTLFAVGNNYHYIEPYMYRGLRCYRLSSVTSDIFFRDIIQLANKTSSLTSLINSFQNLHEDIDKESIKDYVSQLINESVLQVNIPIPLTSKNNPTQIFIEALENIEKYENSDTIKIITKKIEAMDLKQEDIGVEPYKEILNIAKNTPFTVEEGKFFQCDLYRTPKKCEISSHFARYLTKSITILINLHSLNSSPLQDFVTQFNKRFEGQLVPLLKVVDEEIGIPMSSGAGYRSQLMEGISIPIKKRQTDKSFSETILEKIVIQKVMSRKNHREEEIQINDMDIQKYDNNIQPTSFADVPRSFGTMLRLYYDHEGELLSKFNGCYGPSAANLLGRFCHLSEDLLTNVQEHLKEEESYSPDSIFAEVVHMPDGRPGNVIARPHLREYEIIFLGDSSLPEEKQIPISDLYVYVESGKAKLWSKRLKKQIIPRLSSAHNYSSRSLGIYKFLCMLPHQYTRLPKALRLERLEGMNYIPRIKLGNMILQEKTWTIPRAELEKLVVSEKWSETTWADLKDKYQLQRYVNFERFDNVLTLDLFNISLIRVLLHETRDRQHVVLKEALNQILSPAVTSHSGNHLANEIIWPFINSAPKTESTPPDFSPDKNKINRSFAPGSNWLSIKVYGAPSSLEAIIMDELSTLLSQHSELYEKWFFIRYADPDWHLRLRFKGEPASLYGQLLPLLSHYLENAINSGLVHKIEVFTYEQEVERYGGSLAIEDAETLFMLDSEFTFNSLKALQQRRESTRYRIAILACDLLMDSFRYTLQDKLRLIENLREAFGKEFNEHKVLRNQLGRAYQKYIGQIESDLSNGYDDELSAIAKSYRSRAEIVAERIIILAKSGRLSCTIDTLMNSFLHMSNNRVFKFSGREHELIIYDFLRRHYIKKLNTSQKKHKKNAI